MKNNKTNYIVWTALGLTLVNLIVLGTFLLRNKSQHSHHHTYCVDTKGNFTSKACFNEVLDFNSDQKKTCKEITDVFRPQSKGIVSQIDSLKNKMFLELNKPVSDTLLLEKMADDIGRLHTELKKSTYRFYIQMNAVCTPDQKIKLQELCFPMFCKENCPDRKTNCMKKKQERNNCAQSNK